MSQVWVRLLVAVVVVGLAAPIALSAPVQAKGADSCPEPNDEFQRACLLDRRGGGRLPLPTRTTSMPIASSRWTPQPA